MDRYRDALPGQTPDEVTALELKRVRGEYRQFRRDALARLGTRDAIFLRSPDGTVWKVTVSDAGDLTTEPA